MKNIALALLTAAWPAWSALDYARFAHPGGDYVIEYPSDWKRTVGLQALYLQPPGRKGATVRVSLELYPLGNGSPPTPADYIKGLLNKSGAVKKLDARESVMVAGIKADKLTLTETAALKDSYGQKLPGPMREVQLVIPRKGSFYVLALSGVGRPFDEALPEFQRIEEKITFGQQAGKSQKKTR